jgi:hypothetical protein
MRLNFGLLKLSLLATASAGALIIQGCNLYHSSDRDYFDNNGYAGAPVKAALAKPTQSQCVNVEGELSRASLGGLDLSDNSEALAIDRTSTPASVVVRIARKKTEQSASLCKFEFAEPISDEDLQLASQALVETSK